MAATRTVQEICLERGIDARRLAELAGVDGQLVADILLGRRAPSPEERDAIAGGLGRTRDQIDWGTNPPEQHVNGWSPP
jgi:transcriptional regulator with XRE-family HTH domain